MAEWTGSDWASLIGSGLNATGAYLGAQYGQSTPGQVGNLTPKGAAWTQLLGLQTIDQFGSGALQAGNQGLLAGYGGAQQTAGMLPGIAQGGMQAQLGQMAGAEEGAIQHVLKAQKAQLGNVQQQGAASGFYGNTTQQGAQGQVYANASQNIADIMAGTAQAKAGIIGQGTAATMAGLGQYAQAQQATGEAFARSAGAEYNLMKDRLNTILATGQAWGIGDMEQRNLMRLAGGLPAAGLKQTGGSFKPGEGFGTHPWFGGPSGQDTNIKQLNWAKNFQSWLDATGLGDSLWGLY